MKFTIRIHRRWLRRVALGLAVAAVGVPTAQAFDYHQPFGAGIDTASLPCTPSCAAVGGTRVSVTPAVERTHPRGGLMVAGPISTKLAGRDLGPTAAAPAQTTPAAFSQLGRHPVGSLGGPVRSAGGATLDGPSVAAGIGIGTVLAAMLAGLAAMLGRQRRGLARA
jgi:hypothetical protein